MSAVSGWVFIDTKFLIEFPIVISDRLITVDAIVMCSNV